MNNSQQPNDNYYIPEQQPYNPAPNPVEQYSMQWYKFLINFALFFGAIANLAYGIFYITGQVYVLTNTSEKIEGDIVEMVYEAFEGLQTLDILYGVLLIALAGFAIFTRFRLAKFKANGPMCLYIVYAAGIALSLFYGIALMMITELDGLFDSASIASIAFSAAMLAGNFTYFTKRKSLFVN